MEGRHDVEHGPEWFLLRQFSGWLGLIVRLQGCLQFLWDDSLLVHSNCKIALYQIIIVQSYSSSQGEILNLQPHSRKIIIIEI